MKIKNDELDIWGHVMHELPLFIVIAAPLMALFFWIDTYLFSSDFLGEYGKNLIVMLCWLIIIGVQVVAIGAIIYAMFISKLFYAEDSLKSIVLGEHNIRFNFGNSAYNFECPYSNIEFFKIESSTYKAEADIEKKLKPLNYTPLQFFNSMFLQYVRTQIISEEYITIKCKGSQMAYTIKKKFNMFTADGARFWMLIKSYIDKIPNMNYDKNILSVAEKDYFNKINIIGTIFLINLVFLLFVIKSVCSVSDPSLRLETFVFPFNIPAIVLFLFSGREMILFILSRISMVLQK